MIYLFFSGKKIRILAFKKSLFNQEEVSFFHKDFEMPLVKEETIDSVDILASAIKEGLIQATPIKIDSREVVFILPQSFFGFLRIEIPSDVKPEAISIFIEEKAKLELPEGSNFAYLGNYLVSEDAGKRVVSFYSLKQEIKDKLIELSNLLGFKPVMVLPETLAYYKLFEKTLRKEKKELIFYCQYSKKNIDGFIFDNFGLFRKDHLSLVLKDNKSHPSQLKDFLVSILDSLKINRIVLAGPASEEIRQDFFTKEVGVWTNPLKRIIINFYQEYLARITLKEGLVLPVLEFDACLGAFIFHKENGGFINLSNHRSKVKAKFYPSNSKFSGNGSRFILSKRELGIFFISFGASLIFFLIVSSFSSGQKISLPSFNKPTPTTLPTSTPTPTPSLSKEELRLKILNGSGVVGKASEVKALLQSKGYKEIVTGNADSFDYKKTQIRIKKDKESAFEFLVNDLKNNVKETPERKLLDDQETADVIIIIGADFK